jgi:SAM-dependent methyltransferase
MHPEARHFLSFVHNAFRQFFRPPIRVLDVGGGDINGNNRMYFQGCHYDANDVCAAPNVTIVCKTGALGFVDGTFDVVISSECFEHDMDFVASLCNIVRMLKPGGLFVFTCASTGRPEHGTRRTSARCSYTTSLDPADPWCDYYRNLTADDIRAVIDCDNVFECHAFYHNASSHDLYFYGFKRGGPCPAPALVPYGALGCTPT